METTLLSSIPSAMLEQDAQRLGFLERIFPGSAIRSPQQMQILGFILVAAVKGTLSCPRKSQLFNSCRSQRRWETCSKRLQLSYPLYKTTEPYIRQGTIVFWRLVLKPHLFLSKARISPDALDDDPGETPGCESNSKRCFSSTKPNLWMIMILNLPHIPMKNSC